MQNRNICEVQLKFKKCESVCSTTANIVVFCTLQQLHEQKDLKLTKTVKIVAI